MKKLNENSLVKKFAKGEAVTVDLGGTPENAPVIEKMRSSILRDRERAGEDFRTSSHLSDALAYQR